MFKKKHPSDEQVSLINLLKRHVAFLARRVLPVGEGDHIEDRKAFACTSLLIRPVQVSTGLGGGDGDGDGDEEEQGGGCQSVVHSRQHGL